MLVCSVCFAYLVWLLVAGYWPAAVLLSCIPHWGGGHGVDSDDAHNRKNNMAQLLLLRAGRDRAPMGHCIFSFGKQP